MDAPRRDPPPFQPWIDAPLVVLVAVILAVWSCTPPEPMETDATQIEMLEGQ